MFSFLLEIHFWSFSDEISISNNDFGVFKYHFKKEIDRLSFEEKKKSYTCDRNYHWTISNKKTPKLRQNVKELEENLESHHIIHLKWITEDLVIIFLNSGITAYIRVNLSSGDVFSISFDKILKDKLSSIHICDVVTTNLFSLCCHNDPQLTLIHHGKPSFKKIYKKISDLDPRFIPTNLPGPNGRRLPRRLSLNKTGNMVLVWWKYSNDDVFPWSPSINDIDRANLHILHINGSKMEFICYHRTEQNLLSVTFSSVEAHILYVIEQKISSRNIFVKITTFEVIKYSHLRKLGSVDINVQSETCCVEFNPDYSNLLLGCVDGSIVIYNLNRSLTRSTRAAFMPTVIRWHADGYLVAIGGAHGQIQLFDSALNNIEMQCLSEDVVSKNIVDLSVYFTSSATQPPTLTNMEWSSKRTKNDNMEYSNEDGFLLVSFNSGPFVMLRIFNAARISPNFLVTRYLQADEINKAINFLLALDWDICPNICCSLLKEISNFILTSSTISLTEKYSHLQVSLGSFYSPVRPFNNSVELEYFKPVRNISRRIFHFFLRYNLSDQAVTIANYLNEHDLFMDLYHYANVTQNTLLAAMAWEQAERILAEIAIADSSSASENCDCSCSECSCESENSACLPENTIRGVEKLPSPIMVPSSTRASFAAITRVNSTHSVTSQPNPVKSSIKGESSEPSSNSSSSLVNGDFQNKNTSLRRSSIPPPVERELTSKYITNGITKELLHQTGLPESKIKVVHFGVV